VDGIDTDTHRVRPGSKVRLDDWPTDSKGGFDGDRQAREAALSILNERLADRQQMLYAQGEHKFLVVLQGMDTSGKDGTIKHVFRTVNPIGVNVRDFKRPNDVELAHDYLWRVHEHTPRNGRMVIFNRSHYEDVVVVRVNDLVPAEQWRKRRQPGQALEVRTRRHRRTGPLGRLHHRLSGGHRRDDHRTCAVVDRSRRSQVVPQPRGVTDPDRGAGPTRAALSRAGDRHREHRHHGLIGRT